MLIGKLVCISVLSLVFSSSALAQSTLGEAINMGAKKVLKEEFLSLLPATMSGISSTGKTRFELKQKADGSFSGWVTTVQGNASTGSFGTWSMDENGKRCVDETLSSWSMNWKECNFLFKVSGRYFRVSDEFNQDEKIRFIDLVSDK